MPLTPGCSVSYPSQNRVPGASVAVSSQSRVPGSSVYVSSHINRAGGPGASVAFQVQSDVYSAHRYPGNSVYVSYSDAGGRRRGWIMLY
jgi:hypothetical protein